MDNKLNGEAVVPSPVLYKFTNQVESHQLDDILKMFYQGTYGNTLGIMTAFNLTTSEEELVLVGVVLDADGKADCFPLAKILSSEDAGQYLAPNGKGGYYDPRNPTDTAEAKESMRSYNEAVVESEASTIN